MVGYHDFSGNKAGNNPWMIVLPGYGETKTDVLTTSYYLAKNGFHTLRFDYSDHIGESEGEILFTSLTKIKDDILSSVDYLHHRFHPNVLGAVSSSLASRALLRAAREDKRIRLVVNLVSVIDVRKTLFAIYKEDYLERAERGLVNGVMDVLGFQVDADHFLQSAIRDHYEDLETTIEDVSHIEAPVIFFAAENDVWVDLGDVEKVFQAAASDQKDICILHGAMHRLYENPRVVKRVLKEVVSYSARYIGKSRKDCVFHEVDLREIGVRIRKEQDRNKTLHAVTKKEEQNFWKTYLQKYSFIINVHDYWSLLDLLYRLLGDATSEKKILDAGCGIGNYGTFLIMKLIYRIRQSLAAPSSGTHYVSVDFVKDALLQAKATHDRMGEEFFRGFTFPGPRPMSFSYLHSDLESHLPFDDGVFDQVCCNLVISYLRDPCAAVAEMLRVLKPKGRIVVTSLKPFADLSEIYRNFLRVAETKQQIEEAYKLLSNAGRVKVKEAEGIYHFFSEEELTNILNGAGAREVETYRSFGNQANVVTGAKA